MRIIFIFIALSIGLNSCTDCVFGLVGTLAGGCGCSENSCDLEGTVWRYEVVFTGIQQAWTLEFTENSFDSYWGTPGNYYQDHDASGSWECEGSTVTVSSGSSSATGYIEDDVMTIGGKDYIRMD
ncbi:MAG: hypothetical protein A2W93_08715 [Bacteroidetes bacterium GWF2_43_63]|nr:MAG: hypothetical protein A2W94_03080 [Bacteroidetes bacterium GWE2_42_42]OFY55213.1 MAG: hypothetical protein A2W93_08715 [Bacteroidetes bacterium GWF2_43_63]HBG70910.1 hypothetical protein [Bacteroidales bacterium]HCB63326.1 hypothetical protein [Bacteroidales bacterium]